MTRRITILLAALLLAAASSYAQEDGQLRWIDPLKAGAQVHGQGWEELEGTYVRLPDKAKDLVRKDVWNLSRNSAGLSLVFRTDAREITVRYKVKGSLNMYHFSSTGVSGVDMYAYGCDGKPLWCAPVFSASFKETITYRYRELIYGSDASRKYQLLLPTYNTVDSLQIGIPADAELCFIPRSGRKPVVVYGTSIAQGACASRPGNAWTAIVGRKLDIPVVNLGFSGNGRLEPELFRLLAEIDAAVYVIDCLPNMNVTHDIKGRLLEGVGILRARHDCPIILVEHSGTASEYSSELRTSFRQLNAMQKEAYEAILQAGFKDVHYLTREELGIGMDDQVEGVHFNDMGMHHQAEAVCRKIIDITR